MVKKGEGTKTFRSKLDGTQTTYSRTEITNKIAKLEDRLIRSNNLVKDYVNIISNKSSIDANKPLFKQIIKEDLIKQGRYINDKKP